VKRLAAAALVVGAVVAVPAAAAAQETEDRDELVVLSGEARIPEGTTWDEVVIFHGPAVVEGDVGDVVAFDGSVTVTGTVEEDVVAFNGPVTVRSTGTVRGDVLSRRDVVIEDGGRVLGEVRDDFGAFFARPFPFFVGWVLAWLAVSVSTLLLGLILAFLAPRALDAADRAWRGRRGAAVGWGVLFLVGLPLLAVLALVTLLGIPFGIGLLLALGLLYAVGYVVGALLLGRVIVKSGSVLVAFLVGWAILRAIALVPVLGGIVGAVATVLGLGAVAVATWRARRPAEPEPARA
jgi:hypothetical protein